MKTIIFQKNIGSPQYKNKFLKFMCTEVRSTFMKRGWKNVVQLLKVGCHVDLDFEYLNNVRMIGHLGVSLM